jgi:hypothetical protein
MKRIVVLLLVMSGLVLWFVFSRDRETAVPTVTAADVVAVPVGAAVPVHLPPGISHLREPILDCLPELQLSTEGSAENVFTRLFEALKPNIAASRELALRNVHVRLRDGSVRRLQILPGDGAGRMVLRYFTVDAEDLPVPEALPLDLQNISTDEAARRFMNEGEVLLDESEETLRWNDRKSARVIFHGEKVVQLQLFLDQRALLCDVGARNACTCMRH